MNGFDLSMKAIIPLSLGLSLAALAACGSTDDDLGLEAETEARALITEPNLDALARITETVHDSQTTVFSRSTGRPMYCNPSCTSNFCADEARIAQAIAERTNEERGSAGLSRLGTNVCVTQVAKDHSATQARLRRSGSNLLGRDLSGRLLDADVAATASAENLHYHWATGQAFDDEGYPERVMADWLASPAAANRIRNPAFTVMGVGVVKALEGDRAVYYTTQVLMSP